METYVRYEFLEKPDLSYLKEAGHNVVDTLFPFVLVEGEYDEEGNVIKEPVISDKYPVDVIYRGAEPDPELEPFKVTPTTPKHKIAGK